MQRFGLRDDQWERIKDFLPGREGHVGGNAADNRLFVEAVLYRYRTGIPGGALLTGFGRESLGVTCLRVSATGRSCTSASVGGRRAAFSSAFSSCWQAITITNT